LSEVDDRERARLETLFGLEDVAKFDVRPVVRRRQSGLPGWLFPLCAFSAAILLFCILESRRSKLAEPAVRMPAADMRQGFAELPPLSIPPEPAPSVPVNVPLSVGGASKPPIGMPSPYTTQIPPQRSSSEFPADGRLIVPGSPGPSYARPPMENPQPYVSAPNVDQRPLPSAAESRPSASAKTAAPILVIDVDASDAAPASDGNQPAARGSATAATSQPARANSTTNRATTIAQGTLIPAVLETAFDSTNPGYTRAIVSKDVRSFDGSHVLIPRGSRLIGDYKSETSSGQRRALINWTELVRPDGLVVHLDSPAVDPMGGGGIPARASGGNGVGRFVGSLLQSTFDIGRTILMQRAGGTVLLAYPGAIPSFSEVRPQATRDQPRLRVDPGTSISVFVARDLVFDKIDKAK
jgi:type IV secretion system protein VirB10